MIKTRLRKLMDQCFADGVARGFWSDAAAGGYSLEAPKHAGQGDLATNLAMVVAGKEKKNPRAIAQQFVELIAPHTDLLDKVEIAGPGFVNFFINNSVWQSVLPEICAQGQDFGKSAIGGNKKVLVEFVSANPTGPLHVGHGRGAAVGDALARILSFSGYDVQREYYINDSGRQINTLGRSVFIRYEELYGIDVTFPDDCYQGGYILDIAREIQASRGNDLLEFEEHRAVSECARFAAKIILDDIRLDLKTFGLVYDNWYSEQTLYDAGKVDGVITEGRETGLVYEKDGALWFKTTRFGDEKDRVVVRSNGDTTYFASDIAYHREKYDRGFSRVIDVWGADHHGYIPRIRAAIEASGRGKEQFDVILIQLVNLLRDGEPVAMSTRAGEFVALKDVINEVGSEAARFIFLTRHHESPLDFDLALAKKKTNDNPVYYVQYVHARIASIIRNSMERGIETVPYSEETMAGLVAPEEISLIKTMAEYRETVRTAAELMEPHRITYYLITLASAFHAYYNKHRVLCEDPVLTLARLYLVMAVKKVIHNGLSLLGVSSPEKM